jgi:flavorubredoxin
MPLQSRGGTGLETHPTAVFPYRTNMNTTIRPDIHWVGCVDWDVRDFHGYDTDRGSTYNAYLVLDEKTALIDAVKAPFAGQLLENIAARTPTLDYVVCNHAEPDHSGGLAAVIERFPAVTLLCNARCRTALSQYYDTSKWNFQVVREGESICLGRRSLTFIDTPMVHWPESMFTYVPEEKLLFSMDAFGQHYATSARFDDEVPLDVLLAEAKTYYANIVMPYGKAVGPCLEKAAKLPIEMIAPSHGLIWRSGIGKIVSAYRDWLACRPVPKVLIFYDTMWESTRLMADAVYEGALQPGIEVDLIHVRKTNLTRIAAEVLDAAAVAFGSPTLNRGPMPAMAAVLAYLEGLRPEGKAALAFGSYGWASGGVEAVEATLRSLAWETVRPSIKAKYRPTAEILEECRAAGRLLGEKARAIAGEPA